MNHPDPYKHDKFVTREDLDEETLTEWESEELQAWNHADEEYDRRREEAMEERRREEEA